MKAEYKPYLVIHKDTGNTWEFDTLPEAKAKYKELLNEHWGDDIRIMKQNIFTGEFIKWL